MSDATHPRHTGSDAIHLCEYEKRCPSCTYTLAGDPTKTETYGCGECHQTGRARQWRIEAELQGAHWHVKIRAGRPGATAVLGSLVLDEHDYQDLCRMLSHSDEELGIHVQMLEATEPANPSDQDLLL